MSNLRSSYNTRATLLKKKYKIQLSNNPIFNEKLMFFNTRLLIFFVERQNNNYIVTVNSKLCQLTMDFKLFIFFKL
jgi:hypothetical protein